MDLSDEFYLSDYAASGLLFEPARLVSQSGSRLGLSGRPLSSRRPNNKKIATKSIPLSSTLQDLVITLACSRLSDLSIKDRLWPSLGSHLGHGATFEVERREAKGRRLVAVKHIQRSGTGSAQFFSNKPTRKRLDDVLLEVQVLCHLNTLHHESIVELIGYGWDEGPLPFLVLEFADLGSLDAFMGKNLLSWSQKELTLIQLASGLELLHACEIIHGDIKLENILVFSKGPDGFVPKYADFGFCLAESLGADEYHGTRVLNPPEMRNPCWKRTINPLYNFEMADVYSFGIAAWEVANDGHRFYTADSIEIDTQDMGNALRFLSGLDATDGEELLDYGVKFIEDLGLPDTIANPFIEVLKLALQRDPDLRSSIRDIRQVMDPEDDYEPVIAIPLKRPSYSIFDISAAPIPSEVRMELTNTLRNSSVMTQEEVKALDTFTLAAFHTLGFGVLQDDEKSLRYLVEAAKLGYQPAVFYCKVFLQNGILCQNSQDLLALNEHPFVSSTRVLSSRHSESEAAHHIRSAHIYWLRRSLPRTFSHNDITVTELTTESLLNFISLNGSHHLEVVSEMDSKPRYQPLLHHLARIDPALVEELLHRGVSGAHLARDDETLLHVACESGSLKLVQTLLHLHPELARKNTTDGVSPLHWLFMFEDAEIPEVAHAIGSLRTPLHDMAAVRFLRDLNLVFSGPPLHWAIMARNVAAVQALIDLGADVNKMSHMPPDCHNYSPYPVGVASALLMPEMIRILQKHGALLVNNDQDTAAINCLGDTLDPFRLWLYHGTCVEKAAQETLRLLLAPDSGLQVASLKATDVLNFISQTSCHASVLRQFLLFQPSVSSQTLIYAALSFQHDTINGDEMAIILDYCTSHVDHEEFDAGCVRALEICAEDGTVGAARMLLDRLGDRAEAIIDAEGLIHKAATHDHVDMIQLLLAKGGDINLELDGTPAGTAAFYCKRKALRYLLSHGAKAVSLGRDGKYNLLHDIVSNVNPAYESQTTLKMICEEFSDLFIPLVDDYDRRGFTALHEAIMWGNLKNVGRLMVDLRAKPLSIRDKNICPLGLVQLCKNFPPWLITQQGERTLAEYQQSMDSISEYMQHTIGLTPPTSVTPDEEIMRSWRMPQRSQWQPSDVAGDWYLPDVRSDTLNERVKWWGVRWRQSITNAGDLHDGGDRMT